MHHIVHDVGIKLLNSLDIFFRKDRICLFSFPKVHTGCSEDIRRGAPLEARLDLGHGTKQQGVGINQRCRVNGVKEKVVSYHDPSPIVLREGHHAEYLRCNRYVPWERKINRSDLS
jgi:hypothetical protein